jgi:hypothetical protein
MRALALCSLEGCVQHRDVTGRRVCFGMARKTCEIAFNAYPSPQSYTKINLSLFAPWYLLHYRTQFCARQVMWARDHAQMFVS